MKTCRLLLAALVLLCATTVMGEEQEKGGIPYVKLNNGEWMPRLGIGTYNVPVDSVAEDAVAFAHIKPALMQIECLLWRLAR